MLKDNKILKINSLKKISSSAHMFVGEQPLLGSVGPNVDCRCVSEEHLVNTHKGLKSQTRPVTQPCCLVAQLSPTLCISMDCSPSGSSVHGIFQARILEWSAISCRSKPRLLRLLHWQTDSLPLGPPWKPVV